MRTTTIAISPLRGRFLLIGEGFSEILLSLFGAAGTSLDEPSAFSDSASFAVCPDVAAWANSPLPAGTGMA